MSRQGMLAEDKAVVGVVIPKEVKERLRVLAASEDRSLSNFIARILSQYADQHAPAETAKPVKKKSAAK